MKQKSLVLSSLFVAALAGCGGGSASEPISAVAFKPVTVSSCDQLSYAHLPLGDYALKNNPWGQGETKDFTQCVSGSSVGTVIDNTAVQTGAKAEFSWDWPSQNASSNIKAYPEILYRPGGKGLTSIPFAEVAGLTVNHDVSLAATTTGGHNLTYDIWVDSTASSTDTDTDRWPHKAEIMIKVHQTWKDDPVLDTITVNGNQFQVFEHTVVYPSYNWKWKVLVFASEKSLLKASIPLKPFIDYLVAKNYLLQSDHISTIEFGAELKRGKGTATINSYSVKR
ncbi:MAG: GH12 family glycosyl hydrolase domain-containing protein [Burkholderiaceae bacterium]